MNLRDAVPFDVVLELLVACPLSLVEDVAQKHDQLRLESEHGGLEGPVHLPLAAELVEPVALAVAQQVRVRQEHGAEGVGLGVNSIAF